MKIAIFLGPYSTSPRPLDFHYNNIWENPRGLTGSDLALVMIGTCLQKRGHEIHLFTIHAEPHNKPSAWENIKIYNYDERFSIINDSFDAIISLNEPNVFIGLTEKPFRICWQFLNDFPYCEPGYDNYVDKWLAVCQQHMDHLKSLIPPSNKWEVLGLGCEPAWYQDKRVDGRMVWCSSADRGLHWLLQEYPKIKAAVPNATLKIFYHMDFSHIENIEPQQAESDETMRSRGYAINHTVPMVEMGQRIRYIKNAIKKLKHLGVEHIGPVSRDQMRKEFSEASVFPFSCDTVTMCEGFSVSTLESHASFTVPVITSQDCLGSIYKDSGAIVIPAPIKEHLSEYTDAVIRALTDKRFADGIIDNCRVFAMQNTWDIVSEKMESIIKKGK